MKEHCIVFLCGREHIDKERIGYLDAFSRHLPVVLLEEAPSAKWMAQVRDLLGARYEPLVVLHPDQPAWLPPGLADCPWPTACFQIDSYSATSRRVRRSMLYDYVFVFHPRSMPAFARSGHSNVFLNAHAVDAKLFAGGETERCYEVGWVGQSTRSVYRTRRTVLEQIRSRFTTNEMNRWYDPPDMATIYRQSRVGVNISRDDYPADANLRCFEIMAGGALLVTLLPTELEAIGFKEGKDFLGCYRAEDVTALVESCLRGGDADLQEIAASGKSKTLSQHTYDARVAAMLHIFRTTKATAPSRTWTKDEIAVVYVAFHAERAELVRSMARLRSMRMGSLKMRAGFLFLLGLLRKGKRLFVGAR